MSEVSTDAISWLLFHHLTQITKHLASQLQKRFRNRKHLFDRRAYKKKVIVAHNMDINELWFFVRNLFRVCGRYRCDKVAAFSVPDTKLQSIQLETFKKGDTSSTTNSNGFGFDSIGRPVLHQQEKHSYSTADVW